MDIRARMYGRMRIVERYTKRMRVFRGSGGWSLLGPLRFVFSAFYGAWSRMTPSPVPTGPSGSGPKIISVGNIEVGGGGKTPCVLAIASALTAGGARPAVVTRGYGSRATRERFAKDRADIIGATPRRLHG